VGFSITNEEVFQIFKDHNAHKTGYLALDEFYAKLLCWRDYQKRKEAELREIRDSANKVIAL
jgi:hypothetical protein